MRTSLAAAMLAGALAIISLLADGLAAGDEMSVRMLEQQCEQAREAKLKPIRDAEIARCKAEERNDPAFCERYWRDYGNAVRLLNGKMQPRKFDELPECAAAREARRKLNSGNL